MSRTNEWGIGLAALAWLVFWSVVIGLSLKCGGI